MSNDGSPPRDEHRIIEELEQLQDAIRASRARREQAQQQFARHIDSIGAPERPAPTAPRSGPLLVPYTPDVVPPLSKEIEEAGTDWQKLFANETTQAAPSPVSAPERLEPRTPHGAAHAAPHRPAPLPPLAARVATPEDAQPDPQPAYREAVPSRARAPIPEPAPDVDESPLPPDLIAEAAAARARWVRLAGIGVVAVAILAAAGSFLIQGRASAPDDPGSAPAAAAAPATAAPEPEPAPPPAPPPSPVQLTVTTVRHVWLRLVVDGEIRLEREVPAGERYTLGGQRTVTVRAGDAGAVQVSVGNGPASPLGGDGQVLTRRFAPEAR